MEPKKSLILFDRNAATEHFKRSNHTDFASSSELKAMKFNGMRANSITGDAECWIQGEIVWTVTPAEQQINPNAVEEKHREYFGLD